ncbi:unnamed protein product [Schistosoma curassoni]|nr:unnamed protein product [Schistosoma curassoni]
MLGFFSLIGLCRLHCLLGDYYTAIKVLENIKFNRLVSSFFSITIVINSNFCIRTHQ